MISFILLLLGILLPVVEEDHINIFRPSISVKAYFVRANLKSECALKEQSA